MGRQRSKQVPFLQETFPRNKDLPPLFTPLTIRGVTFVNRIFVVSSLGRCFALRALKIAHAREISYRV